MKKIEIAVLLLFTYLGIKALFHPGLYTAHDIWHNVARFYWYVEAIKEGQFLPAWIAPLANGYGYPLFIFSYHLPWLIGAPMVLLGATIENALKFIIILSFFVSGITAFGFAFRLSHSRMGALLAAILYMWTPYHFLVIFVAAAAGIAWAYALLPLVFWGIWEIVAKNNRWGIYFMAVGFSGIFLSHLLMTVMILPIVLIWTLALVLLYGINKAKVFYGLIGIVAGLGLAAYYLIPFASYSRLIAANDPGLKFRSLYATNFVSIQQLLYSRWGYGPITENAKNGEISLQVGIAQWFCIGLLFFLAAFKRSNYLLAGLIVSIFGLSLIFMTDYSRSLWDMAAKLVALDFPFRLLASTALFGSLAAALIVTTLKNPRLRVMFFCSLCLVVIYTNRNHTKVNLYTSIPLEEYIANEKTTNTLDEYLPQHAARHLLKEPRVNTWTQWAFPGQHVYKDTKVIPHTVDQYGLITVTVSDPSNITVRYKKGVPFIVGNAVSIITLIGLGMYAAKSLRRYARL